MDEKLRGFGLVENAKKWTIGHHEALKAHIVTLALGSRPRKGLTRLWAKREAWESHLMLLGV
jgi:hypothetical protein